MELDIGSTFEANVREGDVVRRKVISIEYAPADARCLKVIFVCAFYNFIHAVWMLCFSRNFGGYCISYRERTLEEILVTEQEARIRSAMDKLLSYFIDNPNVWNGYVAGERLDGVHMPGLYLGDVFEDAAAYRRWVNAHVFGGDLRYWDITTQIVAEYLHNFTLAVYIHTAVANGGTPQCELDAAHAICRESLYPILLQLDLGNESFPVNRTQVSSVLKVLFYADIDQRTSAPNGSNKKRKRAGTSKAMASLRARQLKGKGGAKAANQPVRYGGEARAHYDLIVNIADLA